MVKLYDSGVYLLGGKTLIPETSAEVPAGVTKEEAKKGTIAYGILQAHNVSGDPENLKIKFDAITIHDLTYVGIIQTARASGLDKFPLPYVLTCCHNSLCAVGGTINEDDHVFGPNIKDWPELPALNEHMLLRVCAYITDPVTTTDELIPSGETGSFRANPLGLAEFTLSRRVPGYAAKAKAVKADEEARKSGAAPENIEKVMAQVRAIPGFENVTDESVDLSSTIYAVKPGDGSAREQAASCQRVLLGGANIVKEYATKRYRSNLINWGMVPFVLKGEPDFADDDYIFVPNIRKALEGYMADIPAYVLGDTVRPPAPGHRGSDRRGEGDHPLRVPHQLQPQAEKRVNGGIVMANKPVRLPVTIIRGGTSKGVYLLESDLPENRDDWEPLLLRLMGSPDKKQIDGLSGSQSVTSKVAIIKKSDRPDADVDYTFAQVSADKPLVSYKGNCGNISSGVGPFAIEKGLVEAKDGQTSVRIFNTNTGKIIVSDVQTPEGQVAYEGDFTIAGVPGTASPIKLKFVEPAGTLGHGLLPTGNAVDTLDVPDFGPVQVSIVDAANPLVFVKAADLGLRGDELPDELDADPAKLDLLERVRGMAAVKLGLIDDYTRSAWDTPGIPKMTFVPEPETYTAPNGKVIEKDSVDLRSRMMSMQKTHPSYAMTGAMCTAAAAVVPGSIVQQVLSPDTDTQFIRIGHPGGVLECGVDYRENGAEPVIDDTFGFRTANLLMEGTAQIRL